MSTEKAESRRRRWESDRAEGRCVGCRRAPAAPGRLNCGLCLEQYRQKAKNRRTDDPETYRRYAKQTRDKLRDDVLNAYGRVCACCGEDHREFLALDHINGGGVRHRAALGGNIAIYTHVRRQGYPEGFRLLCHNCNQSVGLYGYCPHGGLNDGNNDTPHAFA